jgi:hypothetical protein
VTILDAAHVGMGMALRRSAISAKGKLVVISIPKVYLGSRSNQARANRTVV